MDKVGALIARFPAVALALILVISAVMVGLTFRLDFNTSEEDFNPDSDIARANNEVMGDYGVRVHYVEVVVSAKDGDILTRDCMLDILGALANMTADPLLGPAMLRTTASPTGIMSIADLVLLLNDMYSNIEQVKSGLDLMQKSVGDGADGMNSFAFFLSAMVNKDNVVDMGGQIMNLSQGFQQPREDIVVPQDERTSFEKMASLDTDRIKHVLFDSLKGNFNRSLQAKPVLAKAEMADLAVQNLTDAITNLVGSIEDVKSYPNSTKIIPDTNTTVADVLTQLEATLAFITTPDPQILTQTAFLLFDVIEEAGAGIGKLLAHDFKPDVQGPEMLRSKATMILVQLNGSLEDVYPGRLLECEKMIHDIAQEDYGSVSMRTIGLYMINDEISGDTAEQMVFLIAIALVLLLVILGITYKSVLDMAISFVGICLAVCWTLGFAVILGYTFNVIMIAAPILVIGMGIDYGIHTNLRYKEETWKDPGRYKKAVKIAIGSVGTALVLATVTTCAGFISNLSSELELIRRFSILCVIGVLSSFIVLCVLVSASKLLIDQLKEALAKGEGKGQKKKNKKPSMPDAETPAPEPKRGMIVRFTALGATCAKRSSWAVIIITLLITGISLLGAMKLDTTFEFEDFLPRDSEISDNFRYAMGNFDLSTDESYILVKGDVATPQALSALGQTLSNMGDDEFVDQGSAFCMLTLMRDVADDQRAARPLDLYNSTFAQMYKDSCSAGSDIPVGNVTALFSWLYFETLTHDSALRAIHLKDGGSRENAAFDGALVTVGVTTNKVERGDEIQSELEGDKAPIQDLVEEGKLDKAVVTGGLVVTKVTMDAMTRSQTMSIIITVIVSIVTLTGLFFFKRRSFVLGAITTVPIAFVIAWVLGGMYLLGYKLNMLTITIGSLTVGIGVTYAIHITHRFLEDLEKEQDIDVALDKCLAHSGMAVFGSAATTIGAFAVLLFSSLPPMQQFGGITAMAIIFAMISAIFVMPSMLRIWARWLEDRGKLFKADTEKEKKMDEER